MKTNVKNTTVVLVLISTLVGCASKQKIANIDPEVESQIALYNMKIEDYRSQQAHLISPKNFAKAKEVLEEVKEEAYYEGVSKFELSKQIKDGEKILKKIDRNIELANTHLAKILNARLEAIEEGAASLERFKDADDDLASIGRELEKRDINELLDEKKGLEKEYIKAEVEAIQKRELSIAYKILERAQDLDAVSKFSKEQEQVELELAKAKEVIAKNKDNEEQYIPAIRNAEDSAERLFVLTQTAQWIEETDTRKLVLTLDRDLNTMLAPLSYGDPQFMNYDQKIEVVKNEMASIPYLMKELSVAQYDALIQKMNTKNLAKSNQKMSEKLAAEQRNQQKLERVKKLFNENEAEVLIKDNDLVVKLVGLNFALNKSDLPNDGDKILNKVAESAQVLDFPKIEIVGHADSQGDALYNQELSKKRAQTVNDYLVKNKKLSQSETEVSGAGFRKPVSDNMTEVGRKTNRRIDVVFQSVVQ